ncbi:hypothetical protein HDF23_003957 [Mucilaginibacter lappiensis]|uniref:Uncharacterized protein n=1 Tax=Mucilaginibacter lappiensis TaxID=354630 RepID=A0ABR6PN70_9SPHI|nr:hypothetical protein [Mucilaginibacter lappiensis]MBB6111190.1 hypothetical protein [Mucilaginibacter lappiensis]
MFNSHIKASFKKYLLAFGFMVSFFALPGYVSQNIPGNNRVWGTELFSDKNFVSKGGISYKRGVQNCSLIKISFQKVESVIKEQH